MPLPVRGEPKPAWSSVTRIDTATNTAGKPIKVAATPSLAIVTTP